MYKAKTVKMQGFSGKEEDVVPARERVLELKSLGIPYTIWTEPYEFSGKQYFRCKLTLLFQTPQTFTGNSEIKLGEIGGFEAAETRSIGRAIAAYGIGIEKSYASAEEFAREFEPDENASNSVSEIIDKLEVVKARVEESKPETFKAGKKAKEKPVEIKEELKTPAPEPEIPELTPGPEPEVAENAKIEVMSPTVDAKEKEMEESGFHNIQKVAESVKKDPISPNKDFDTIKVTAKEEPKPEPVAEVTTSGDSTNKYGIEIPKIDEGKGGREFNAVMGILTSMVMKDEGLPDRLSSAVEKLGMHKYVSTDKDKETFEILLEIGTVEEINACINHCVKD